MFVVISQTNLELPLDAMFINCTRYMQRHSFELFWLAKIESRCTHSTHTHTSSLIQTVLNSNTSQIGYRKPQVHSIQMPKMFVININLTVCKFRIGRAFCYYKWHWSTNFEPIPWIIFKSFCNYFWNINKNIFSIHFSRNTVIIG